MPAASELLLDERQRGLLEGEYDNMLACVRCAACLTSCPTYVLSGHEAEGPRGRIAMMRAVAEGHLALTADLVRHEDNCLVCDACTAVCPAGIHMDPMQVALRRVVEPHRQRRAPGRILRWLVFRQLFAKMGSFRFFVRLLRLYQALGLQWLARHLGILRLLGLQRVEALLPEVAQSPLVPRGESYPAAGAAGGPNVQFFAGCVMSTALAEVDRATIRVLQRSGCTVHNPAGQGCCGALNAHGGDLDGALAMARRNVAAFESTEGSIVVNSAGCGAMLKEYAHHFRDDPEWAPRAAAFSGRVRDVTEVLVDRPLPFTHSLEQVVVYQDACHLLHAQRIREQPRSLLRSIPGLDLREMSEPVLCCGSAGIYNVTNPRESRQLQQRKVDHAAATGASALATANPGCLFQLRAGFAERGLPVRVAHVMELLDEATSS